MQPTKEQEAALKEWIASRPDAVRAVAERFDVWTLYRMKSSGHRVTIYSFNECPLGSIDLTVNVLAAFNLVQFERQVFDVKPDDLEECDLPKDGEPLGAMMSQEQVVDNLDEIRLSVRPDLWKRAADGSAVLKAKGAS